MMCLFKMQVGFRVFKERGSEVEVEADAEPHGDDDEKSFCEEKGEIWVEVNTE